jgi:lia operon protein LiaG
MKKAVFILFIIMVVSFTLAGITLKVTGVASPVSYSPVEVNEEQKLDLEAVRELRLKTAEYDIHVIPVEDDNIRLHFHGKVRPKRSKSPWIETRKRAGQLEVGIADSSNHMRLSFNRAISHLNQTGALDVYLPRNYREKLKTDMVSGTLRLAGFKLAGLNCHSVSGNIILENFQSEQTVVETVSGDVNNQSLAGQVKIKTVSGDINTVVAGDTYLITMETTSGDTQISLPKDAQFELGFETISGEYQSDIPIQLTKADRQRLLEGAVGDPNSGNRIEVRTISGNLRIREKE